MAAISVRNVTCDFYMEKPNGFNRKLSNSSHRIPILRIFGILNSGQKCCVHIHGVFPYILLRIGAELTPEIKGDLLAMLTTMAQQMDRRTNSDFALYEIEHLMTKSMYGFHKEEESFAKILFYSPQHLKMVSDVLQREAFSNSSFQVFEAHIPYILQFFIDYSIFGMDFVHLENVKFRISPKLDASEKYIDDLDLSVEQILNNTNMLSPLLPSTTVAVECDAFASDIVNSEKHSESAMSSNPGLDYIWKDEIRRCNERGMKLDSESSQEERSAFMSEDERSRLHRIRDIVKRLKLLTEEKESLTPSSSFAGLHETLAELNRTLAVNRGNERDTGQSLDYGTTSIFSDIESIWVEDVSGREEAHLDEAQAEEREEAEDMSQALLTVCDLPASPNVVELHPSAELEERKITDDEFSRLTDVDSHQAAGVVLCSGDESISVSVGARPSKDDTKSVATDFSLLVRPSANKESEHSGNLGAPENSLEHVPSPGSASLFGSQNGSSLETTKKGSPVQHPHADGISFDNKSNFNKASKDNSESDNSGSSRDFFGQDSESSQDFYGKRSEGNLDSDAVSSSVDVEDLCGNDKESRRSVKRKLSFAQSGSRRSKAVRKPSDLSSGSESSFSTIADFENDIGTLWNPSRPKRKFCSFDKGFRESGPFDFIKAKKREKDESDDEGMWWTPTYLLPLRSRAEPTEEIESYSQSTNSTVANKLEFSQNSDNVDSAQHNATVLESLYEPSFGSYDGKKERLEATIRTAAEPAVNSDNGHSGIGHLSVLSLEILTLVRPHQPAPDPQSDQIIGVFCSISKDVCLHDCSIDEELILLFFEEQLLMPCARVRCFSTEDALFDALIEVMTRVDPDIVIGYNTVRSSWGYLVERGIAVGRNLLSELSRYKLVLSDYYRPEVPTFTLDATPRGRILINVWRTIRSEIALRSYTKSNVVQKVLNRRFPEYSHKVLTEWILSKDKRLIDLVIRHQSMSARLNLRIMCQLDLFTRVSEMARVYGIQFAEVLSRGSQFRVESMLLRLARRHKLAAASVSPAQRSAMCSPEVLALNMEPESGLYWDPVIVLDFQSLYPSVMIAYNYCFSTCLGKVVHMDEVSTNGAYDSMELGGLRYRLPVNDLARMVVNDQLHVSPVGTVFCKKNVRKGVVPIMLEEILNTRIMVKKSAKNYKSNPRLMRILDARQLALKLVANVTYGYSAANFSGRMPCVEVADAIVSKGREALERAIAMVNTGKYGSARVIYGDTDSLFVLCTGCSRQEAFDIGERIANDVTMANPNPMKLKLEKIMHPVILEAKKRYVGMSYEKRDDAEGVLDAKGIETVRRDTCPLVARILEKSLRLLFANDIPAVVRYVSMQLANLDALPVTDFIFSREYRSHYADTAVVASKRIAQKRRLVCPRDEPEAGERVPYVIVDGEPKATLISCVREPWEFILNKRLSINQDYYVQRHVLPSLHRAFDYVPLHFEWHRPTRGDCYMCKALGGRPWCTKCASDPMAMLVALCDFQRERRLECQMDRLCRECLGLRNTDIEYAKCTNLACLITQKRINLRRSNASDAVRRHHCQQ